MRLIKRKKRALKLFSYCDNFDIINKTWGLCMDYKEKVKEIISKKCNIDNLSEGFIFHL